MGKKINKIEIEAFRGYENYTLFDFTKHDTTSDLIVLHAPNGFGKTSLLRALTIGLYGDLDHADQEKRLGEKNTEVELQVNFRNKDGKGSKPRWVSQKGEYAKIDVPVLAYGPVRIPTDKGTSTSDSNVKSLFDSDGDLLHNFESDLVNLYQIETNDYLIKSNEILEDYQKATSALYSLGAKDVGSDHIQDQFEKLNQIKSKDHLIGEYLRKKDDIFSKSEGNLIQHVDELERLYSRYKEAGKKLPRYDAVYRFLLQLMDNIKHIEVEKNRLLFYEKEDPESGKIIKQLASGNRMLFTWIGDLLIRLKYINFEHPFEVKGIVFIDELDLHLHPKWQSELPSILSKNLPNVQFVASTHSPVPLLGAPENSVFIKVDRNESEGIKAFRLEKLEKEIKLLRPNNILTSDIFDFDFYERLSENELENLYSEDHYQDIKKNREIENRLRKVEKNIFPDKLF